MTTPPDDDAPVELRPANVAPAAVAGLGAAVVGGAIWGLIVKLTGYEVGFVGWGIGFLVGTAVVLGAGNRRGRPLQAVAVVLALVGIVVGKYLSFVWAAREAADDLGIPFELPIFSADTLDLFVDARSEVWSWFDLLWVGLAVFTAFRIPQQDEPVEPAEEAQAPENR